MTNLFVTRVFRVGRKQSAKKGQSLAEYGLVLALVAVACITALGTLGNDINSKLKDLSTAITNVTVQTTPAAG